MIEIVNQETGEVVKVAPFLRSPYNYDMNAASDESGVDTGPVSLAQQQFKEEVDINTIVRRFGITGELPKDLSVPVSGDFTEMVTDFHSAMNMVRKSEEAFMQLPAEVRSRFNNDPQRLMEFVENKDNIDEARKLGIAVPAPVVPPPAEPMAVRIVEPAAK